MKMRFEIPKRIIEKYIIYIYIKHSIKKKKKKK